MCLISTFAPFISFCTELVALNMGSAINHPFRLWAFLVLNRGTSHCHKFDLFPNSNINKGVCADAIRETGSTDLSDVYSVRRVLRIVVMQDIQKQSDAFLNQLKSIALEKCHSF